jgi:hypothetical protein
MRKLSGTKPYGVDFISGHTSTILCAAAQGVLDTRLTPPWFAN